MERKEEIEKRAPYFSISSKGDEEKEHHSFSSSPLEDKGFGRKEGSKGRGGENTRMGGRDIEREVETSRVIDRPGGS